MFVRRLERHHHGGHDQHDRDVAPEVIIYEPFTGWGTVAAGIGVVARSSNADCYSSAISSPRRDTFRCITKQNRNPGTTVATADDRAPGTVNPSAGPPSAMPLRSRTDNLRAEPHICLFPR